MLIASLVDFSSIRAHSLVRRPPMSPASARIVGWSRRRIQRSENGSRNSDYNSGWRWELCDLLNSLILFLSRECSLHYSATFLSVFLFPGQTFPKKGQRVVVHYVGECGGWSSEIWMLFNVLNVSSSPYLGERCLIGWIVSQVSFI